MIYHIICDNCGSEVEKSQRNGQPPRYCSRACWIIGQKEEKKLQRASVNYWTVHRRVRNDRGQASQYPCAHCGGKALDWAMRHGTDGFNSSMFDPLCRKCHIAYDGSAIVNKKKRPGCASSFKGVTHDARTVTGKRGSALTVSGTPWALSRRKLKQRVRTMQQRAKFTG